MLAAGDFFAVEVWTWRGLVTHYILFVIEVASRRIYIAGLTEHQNNEWMIQVGRNLLDAVDGPLRDKQYLILDRDTKYCWDFWQLLARDGVEVIRLPPRSPNLNAYAERWVRSAREECLSKVIPIGQGMLRHALREFVEDHHLERNHQGLCNALITPCHCCGPASHCRATLKAWRHSELLRTKGGANACGDSEQYEFQEPVGVQPINRGLQPRR